LRLLSCHNLSLSIFFQETKRAKKDEVLDANTAGSAGSEEEEAQVEEDDEDEYLPGGAW
jgi:hypothetical protein